MSVIEESANAQWGNGSLGARHKRGVTILTPQAVRGETLPGS